MTPAIFAAVLFAALLHASWNAMVKFGSDKMHGMVLLSVSHGIIGIIMALFYPLPPVSVWGWLAASGLCHFLYKFALTSAYERGDLSRVYPIARGLAPMLVAIVSLVILTEPVTRLEYIGIAAIGFGILLLARGVFTQGESVNLLPFAVLSAFGTAGYSIVDGLGARALGNATQYVAWLFILDAFTFVVFAGVVRGKTAFPNVPRLWSLGLVAGAFSVGAYWIAVYAMTIAPIALVTALRETSVLFAVLIGIFFFKEKADTGKLIAACVIVCGIILIRI